MKIHIQLVALLLFVFSYSYAQPYEVADIVEVSGVVVTPKPGGGVNPVAFATVSVKDKNIGTYANYNGMFSIVVKKGQVLNFTALGYSSFDLEVPKDFEGLHYSVIIKLDAEDINLSEVLVFPWPDRDNFRAEFLAMEPNLAGQMEQVAKDNLDKRTMMQVAEATKPDGRESATQYLRQQANAYSYQGQMQPMPILSPLAWAEFFKQITKKKEEKKKDKWGDD